MRRLMRLSNWWTFALLFVAILSITACGGGDDDDDSNDDDDDNDDTGDDDDDTGPVCDPPVAQFSATPRTGDAPLAVAYTDESTSDAACPITAWAWEFGDSGTGDTQDPTHTYQIGDTYTVSLTVTNSEGSDTETKTGYVTASCPLPVADFGGTPTSGNLPLDVTFTDQSVTHCPTATYEWAFGDSGTSALQSPTHSYTTQGDFSVTLTVTTSGGADTETKANYISGTCALPQANFSANRTSGRKPFDVSFSDTSTSYCEITAWEWRFGDIGTSSLEDPSHVYDNPGTYTVDLTVTNAGGQDTETKSDYITVDDNPLVGSVTLGDARQVVVVADYAYVANGESGFAVVDVSDPSNPVIADQTSSRSKVGIDVQGDYAYLADANIGDGIYIYNISDPENISYSGAFTEGGLTTGGVDVAGNTAYVAARGDGLYVLDVSDPSDPDFVTAVDPGGYMNGVTYTEYNGRNYVIAAIGSGGIAIFDVTADPEDPQLLGTYNTGDAERVFMEDRYAYISDGTAGMEIADALGIYPVFVGEYDDLDSFTLDVYVKDDYAYLGDATSGLRIIDVSTPESPTLEGTYELPGREDWAQGVFVTGGFAFVANNDEGLTLVDVSNPALPTLEGEYTRSSQIARDVLVEGDYAYLADNNFFIVLDISIPGSPSLSDSYGYNAAAVGVDKEGQYAYVANMGGGLQIMNVSNPANITRAGYYEDEWIFDVETVGDYAFCAGGGDGLIVIDVSTPGSPSEVVITGTDEYADKIVVHDSYAFMVVDDTKIEVWDITDPADPILAGEYNPYAANSVFLTDQHLYIADGSDGLEIADWQKKDPAFVGEYHDGDSFTQELAKSGRYVYVAEYGEGLRVIDALDPTNPDLEDSYRNNGYPYGVTVDGDYVYLADSDNGLLIFHKYPTNW